MAHPVYTPDCGLTNTYSTLVDCNSMHFFSCWQHWFQLLQQMLL